MNKKLSVLRRITAVVLCVTLLSSQVVVANVEDSERMNVQTNSEIADISEQDGFSSDTSEISDITESDIPDSFEGESEPNADISSEVTEEFGNSKDQGFTDGDETIIDDENTSDTLEEANPDYEDGKICIYNYQQLLQIGTGTQMFSGDKDGNVGEGDKVLADGAELTYASDASYCLMNDIPIDNENVWNFPSDFTGSITSSSERTGNTVYDSVTDTIYVYNRYQLELMKGESSDSEPVMSEDYIAEKVGMGQVFTLEDGSYLTYSKTHNYVLASSFTTETPELLANKAGTEETTQDITSAYPSDYEGRNYFGQVVKKIGDKNYILIGNEEQLREIGSKATVYGAVYQAYEDAALKWHLDTDSDGNPIMLYGGDADLSSSQNGNKDYSLGAISDTEASLGTHKANIHGKCGVNQATGKIEPNLDIDKASGQTYSPTANYIIFRDIDLSSANWTPLMFSGNMIGAKANGQSTLWQNDASVTDYSKATELSTNVNRPVISNITVNQTGKMDGTKYIGIGFFATVTNDKSLSSVAHKIIPYDSTPRNFTGFKFVTTTTCFPINSSGL